MTNRDRMLLRAVDYVEKTMHACGHSLLRTTRTDDLGHFKVEDDYCEACKKLNQHSKSAGEDKIGGRLSYAVDRRLAED